MCEIFKVITKVLYHYQKCHQTKKSDRNNKSNIFLNTARSTNNFCDWRTGFHVVQEYHLKNVHKIHKHQPKCNSMSSTTLRFCICLWFLELLCKKFDEFCEPEKVSNTSQLQDQVISRQPAASSETQNSEWITATTNYSELGYACNTTQKNGTKFHHRWNMHKCILICFLHHFKKITSSEQF